MSFGLIVFAVLLGGLVLAILVEAYLKKGAHRPLSQAKPRVAEVNRKLHHNFLGKEVSTGHRTLLDDLQDAEAAEERQHLANNKATEHARQKNPTQG